MASVAHAVSTGLDGLDMPSHGAPGGVLSTLVLLLLLLAAQVLPHLRCAAAAAKK